MDERTATRFWSKVDRDGPLGCWLWNSTLDRTGYGRFRLGSQTDGTRRYEAAHRLAYEAVVGPIPEGLYIDHLCRVHNCVRPDHLEPVTNRENLLRGVTVGGINARKTHCKHGHEFSPENTYRIPPGPTRPDGGRECRTCRKSSQERVRARRRARDLTARGDVSRQARRAV